VQAVPTVLQVIPRLDPGGAELSAIEITEALVKAGARALVACDGGQMAAQVTALGGEIVTLDAGTKSPLGIIANAGRLARLIGQERVSLVHARSRAPAWSALIAARRTGRPLVTTYHGAYAEPNALKRLYNSVMVRSDRVIANSHYTKELIQSRYATSDQRIRVIHRGVDAARFDPAAVDVSRVAALRAAWGVPDGHRIVLLAARLTSWKGQAILIEAARRLEASGRLADAVVVLAGGAQGRDGYVASLEAQIRAGGLEQRVRIVGHVGDMPAAFAAAHVAVVASTAPEAFGRSGAEAQCMGCPVIATRIGAPQETVLAEPATPAERITGWLVAPTDASALAEALAAALALSEPARAAIGARARAHVTSAFSLEGMQRATLAVYDELLATGLAAAFDRSSALGASIDPRSSDA
jgi:glycosyltransferase involved in cell wall biosynthesis